MKKIIKPIRFEILIANSWFRLLLAGAILLIHIGVNFGQIEQKIKKRCLVEVRDSDNLGAILSKFEKKLDCVFSYTSDRLDLQGMPNLTGKERTYQDYLEAYLQPQFLNFRCLAEAKIVLYYDPSLLQQFKEDKSKFTLTGRILDKEDNEPLIGAHIYTTNYSVGTITGDNGYFTMDIPTDTKTISVSYLGYQQRVEPITKFLHTSGIVLLNSHNQITEVNLIEESPTISYVERSMNKWFSSKKYSFSKSRDATEVLRKLPSVQSRSEGNGQLSVRGGTQDQNLIMMDGVPIYETTHLFGLSSVINGNSVKSIEFYKQAFPAKYGGRLSSIVDFKLDNGNKKYWNGSAHLNSWEGRLELEGPLVKDKSSINISAKKSLLGIQTSDLIQSQFGQDNVQLNYFDINAKIHTNIDNDMQLSVGYYQGGDEMDFVSSESFSNDLESFSFDTDNNISWGNRIFNLNLNKIWSQNNISSSLKLYNTAYNYQTQSNFSSITSNPLQTDTENLEILTLSELNDYGALLDFDQFVKNDVRLQYGVGSIVHRFKPAIRQSVLSIKTDIATIKREINEQSAVENFAYSELYWNILPQLRSHLGIRANFYHFENGNHFELEPRVSLNATKENHNVGVSYSRMSQFMHLLINPGIGLPSELWVPSRASLKPEISNQVSFSYKLELPGLQRVKLESYLKFNKNIIAYNSAFDLFNAVINDENNEIQFTAEGDILNNISQGSSRIRGLEILYELEYSNFQFSTQYALVKNERTFSNINNGKSFNASNTRLHDFNFATQVKLPKDLVLLVEWNYGSGTPFTLATESYIGLDGRRYYRSNGRNTFRLPDYHRLDLAIKWNSTIFDNMIDFEVGVLNAYDRSNTYYVYVFENELTKENQLRNISILPRFPYLKINMAFK